MLGCVTQLFRPSRPGTLAWFLKRPCLDWAWFGCSRPMRALSTCMNCRQQWSRQSCPSLRPVWSQPWRRITEPRPYTYVSLYTCVCTIDFTKQLLQCAERLSGPSPFQAYLTKYHPCFVPELAVDSVYSAWPPRTSPEDLRASSGHKMDARLPSPCFVL